MITTIAKQFTFDAAHFLPTVPEGHKCRRMHGHTYGVELQFQGDTGATGFCADIDYADIAKVWALIHQTLDHRELNQIPGLEVPSTENLVQWIMTAVFVITEPGGIDPSGLCDYLIAVKVSESSTTWCIGNTPCRRDMAAAVSRALRLGAS